MIINYFNYQIIIVIDFYYTLNYMQCTQKLVVSPYGTLLYFHFKPLISVAVNFDKLTYHNKCR